MATSLFSINIRPYFIWLIAGMFYLYEFVHRVWLSVLVNELIDFFSASPALIGTLSASYFFAYAIAQIPVGILFDKYPKRNLLTMAAAIITLGSFIFTQSQNIYVAMFCRAIIGFGSAFSFIGCLKLAAELFPKHRYALMVGLTNLLGALGAIIGGRPIAIALNYMSWQELMVKTIPVGVILSFALYSFIPRTKEKSETKFNLLSTLKSIFNNPGIIYVGLYGSMMVAPIATYSELWGVNFLVNIYSIPKDIASQITTSTFLGIAIGGAFNGYIADRTGRKKLIMYFGAITALFCFATIMFIRVDEIMLYILHLLLGFSTSTMLLGFSINMENTNLAIRGTMLGVTNMIIVAVSATFQTVYGFMMSNSIGIIQSFIPLILCHLLAIILMRKIKV